MRTYIYIFYFYFMLHVHNKCILHLKCRSYFYHHYVLVPVTTYIHSRMALWSGGPDGSLALGTPERVLHCKFRPSDTMLWFQYVGR